MTERSETRDGMRIDWDVPITMDDGLVLRADVFRPIEGGQAPGHPHLRPLRERPRVPGRLSERVAAHGGEASRRRGGLIQPLSELGSGRPGEMGAARLCLRARGFARRRLLARLHRSFLAARDEGFLRLHRMGRRAAVVERQGRAERHLVLRHQPVARRLAAAAASRRDVRLGRRGRLVSRHDASRRHALDLLGQLVRHAGEDRAVRRGRARQALARARRTGVRAGDADARNSSRRTAATSATRSARIRSTTSITRRARRSGTRSRRRCSRRRTGADRACIRAAISRALCARASKDKWLEAHGIEHWTHFYTDYGRELQRKFFDFFLKGEDTGWGKQPRVLLQVRHPGEKFVERAENEWPIARTQVDQALSQLGRLLARPKPRSPARRKRDVRRARRRRHLHDAAAASRDRDHRPGRGETVRVVIDQRTPTCSWCCACSRPT